MSGKPKKEFQITVVAHESRTLFPAQETNAPSFSATIEKGGIRFTASEPGDYELWFSGRRVHKLTLPPANDPLTINGPWEVGFPHGQDIPVRQVFSELVSWTGATNLATRAFSGTAVYARTFSLGTDRVSPDETVILDLGGVREVARVYLNGREIGISGFPPHRLEVTGKLRVGENHLVVEVANTWLNRLIADDKLPPEERKTHTNLAGWRGLQPKPSGLLGPVQLVFRRSAAVKAP